MTKTHFTALCFIVLAFASTSCDKKGCMDKTANNYDPEATKDDGSCTYDPADALVGTYLVTDTLIKLGGLSTGGTDPVYYTTYSQVGWVISKQDANTLSISNFGPCQTTIHTTVSTNSLIIKNDNASCPFGNPLVGKIININGKNLRYLIPYKNPSGSNIYLDTLKGIAIKQ